jgi:hypothetical protein
MEFCVMCFGDWGCTNKAEGRGSTSELAKIIVFLAIQSYVVKNTGKIYEKLIPIYHSQML